MITPDEIKALRIARGWNQQQMAEQIGVDQATISRIERGAAEPSGPVVILIEKMIAETPEQAADASKESERAA